jgi:spoIIIJ-associated protein
MIADALPLAEQGAQAGAFLEGLLEAFALDGQVELRELDEDTVEAVVTGDDLGLLIGPKGATLSAVQDLARTVVQRHSVARTGRLLVDISGYRQRRREALERFTKQVAEAVLQSGEPTALEPMTPADRKVVHDTATTIDGVRTTSEGEEPRRRVVVLPD